MAVNISELLQKFQLRGAFSIGTEILGKATGTNASPSSYPVALFLKGLFDLLSVDAESKTISYIDKEGNVQQMRLGLDWKDFTDKEKAEILGNITTGTLADLLGQLSGYVEAERLRVSAEQTREQKETQRNSSENARLTAEAERKVSENERVSAENTRKSNEAVRVTSENTRQSEEEKRQSEETKRVSAENTRKENESVRQSNEEQRKKNEAQRIIDENLRQTNSAIAVRNAEEATANAQETAEHPTYFDEDLYQYKWDSASKSYIKTEVNAGTQLRVDYVYSSVAELEADTANIPDGKIAVVNTGDVEDADNARFYIRFKGAWKFLVDLSGIQGAQGFTPQLYKGNITVGADRHDALFTIRQEGKDGLGNPKYFIDFRMPSFAYSDFTEEQIKELQSPATAMIAVLEATDKTVSDNEKVREVNETARMTAESNRIANEDRRKENENARLLAEQERDSNETERQSQESLRVSSENERLAAETERIAKESERQTNEDSRIADENDRLASEMQRQSNENERVSSENTRIEKEGERLEAEKERAGAETLRKEQETERVRTEAERTEAELARIHNESVRNTQEEERTSNETSRLANETERQLQEEQREESETVRNANETQRILSESARRENETVREENEKKRIREVDELVKRLNAFEVTEFERRIYELEINSVRMGEVLGEDDEIDPSVWD